MKYIVIINSDDELSEDIIEKIKDTIFVGNENAKYCFEVKDIVKVPILDERSIKSLTSEGLPEKIN